MLSGGKNKGNINCLLCKNEAENISHLLFYCPYSRYIWFIAKSNLNINLKIALQNIRDSIQCIQKVFNGKKKEYGKACIVLTTIIYFIWKERNGRLQQNIEIDCIQLWKTIETECNLLFLKACNVANLYSHNQSICDLDIYVENVEEYIKRGIPLLKILFIIQVTLRLLIPKQIMATIMFAT